MSAVNILLDKYREARAIASDSALADSLHMSRQAVHQWRKGLSWPSEDHVIAMTKAINEPAERWFVAISADRASPAGRKIWMKLLQAAALVALTVGVAPTHGETVSTGHNPPANVYYVKLRIKV